jgi:hypothetical protein
MMANHIERGRVALTTLLELTFLLTLGLSAAVVIRTEPLISTSEQGGTAGEAIIARLVRPVK